MDFGKIIARVKAILTTPQTEWPVIAAEPATAQSLYINYILVLAALPAIAQFIKGSLMGSGAFGVVVRTPFGAGLGMMVASYLLSLVMLYLLALIVSALAPSFGGQKDPVQALKAIAYSWTASWVAGIAVILPWLGWLISIAGLVYAIYLLYLGLPHTMKCPPEKSAGYTAVSVVIGVVLTLIVGWIVGLMFLSSVMLGGGSSLHSATITSSDGSTVTVDKDSALGKLAAMGERAEKANKELEAAQKSGDTAAQQAAMGKVMGAAMGNDGSVQSLSADQVKAFLPDTLAGLKRESLSAERSNAVGMQITEARAQYGDGNGHSIELEVSDTGSMKGMMAMASALAPESEQQTDHGYEKTYTDNGRLVHEAWDKTSKNGEYSVVVAQRFSVKATGQVDSIDPLKQAVTSVDLSKLESLKNEGVTKN
ncbi:Yip1 family protein [Dyella subtropica]|uniref:Yip1 family protein n=1 Tax=Dyella subtropica TaxID=2992127 RepID=UPI00224FBF43|nr:Yip1 family protein [Dyella subtropica]